MLLRRTFRDGAKVRHETVANLSMLPAETIAAIEATLKGHTLVAAGHEFTMLRSLPHGHVAAVAAMARELGLPGCWARRAGRGIWCWVDHLAGDSARVEAVDAVTVGRYHPGCRPAVADASTDEIYAAMDWLTARQDAIEKKLAAKHLAPSR